MLLGEKGQEEDKGGEKADGDKKMAVKPTAKKQSLPQREKEKVEQKDKGDDVEDGEKR